MTDTQAGGAVATAAAPAHPDRKPAAVLGVVLLGQFMAILDTTIVNVAAPTIRTDLHTSTAALQFAVSGYTLSYAVLLILGARLGDRLGHGRMFRGGLAGFVATSLLCGVAPTAWTLVAFRVLQGSAAAMMMPQVMSLIQRTFVGSARQRALSMFSAVVACAAIIGQVAGGVLVSADLFGSGWRPIFLLNVPIGLILIILARRLVPHEPGDPARRLDAAGTTVIGVALLLLVLPLVLGREQGWPAWTFVALGASALLVAVFVRVERRVEARGGSPVLPRRLLHIRALAVGAATLFVAMLNYSANLFVMALHLQGGLGESAARAGLTFAPQAVGFAATSLSWHRLPARYHGRIIPIGFAVAALAYLGDAAVLHDGHRGGPTLAVVLLILGAALGLALSPLMGVTLTQVPVTEAANASAVMVTVFQLGQVVGVATLGSIYLSLASNGDRLASAHAFATTAAAMAGCAALAGLLSASLIRRERFGL